MNSYERIMSVLDGQKPDRIPVFPLVREWCVRQAGFKAYEAILDASKYAHSQYLCVQEFDYDMVRDLGGIHCESEAMGSKLKFPEDAFPSVIEFAIKDYKKDLPKLKIPDPYKDGRMPIVLEGIYLLKGKVGKEIPVLGYLQAPFRHASMLRSPDKILTDVYKSPQSVKDLLELCVSTQIVWGTALLHAGADVLFISDPMSSGDVISSKIWMTFAQPYTTKVVSALKKLGAKIIMHICGDTTDRLETMMGTGVDCLSLDSKVNMDEARKILGEDIGLMGNLDPTDVLVFGNPEKVEKESLRLMISVAGTKGNYILSSGCTVPVNAPPENIRAMVSAGKKSAWDTFSQR
ncbi:MAG: uroporphyrinogen decarboxylase family protein [Syntrophaceae bacterium]|nr:uroporphyrinogen decarboxylase family protein [Syntrophaceae bacterium]